MIYSLIAIVFGLIFSCLSTKFFKNSLATVTPFANTIISISSIVLLLLSSFSFGQEIRLNGFEAQLLVISGGLLVSVIFWNLVCFKILNFIFKYD